MKNLQLTKKQPSTFNNALVGSILAIALFAVSNPLFAEGGSVHHSGQASKHSALAISAGAKTSTRVVSGVVAVPLLVVGGVSTAAGASVTGVGESIASGPLSMRSVANHQAPLEVTDLIITADPAPNKVTITRKTTEIETETVIETQ